MAKRKKLLPQTFGDLCRHGLTAWLAAALLEYLLLSRQLQSLDALTGLSAMSFPRLCFLTLAFTVTLWLLAKRFSFALYERWGMAAAFGLLSILALTVSFQKGLLFFCGAIFAILVVYALRSSRQEESLPEKGRRSLVFALLTGALALGFFLFVSFWTVRRYQAFHSPTYDFGIFAQMFHNMKTTGLPMTTVERDGPLSHFAVHVSPIYYLMLPFYCLVPRPETLQVLQAAVLASAVIPMWLIGKHRGAPGWLRFVLCALLLLLPSSAGGAYYDLHENCFLLPLVLWLMYAIDRRKPWLIALFGVLTLTVKEDAAVYVAVAALYLIVDSLLHYRRDGYRPLLSGIGLLAGAIVWFLAVTGYLAAHGDGVMTYRYQNLMYDGSGSLISVICAILLHPMKVLYECADPEKWSYLLQTLGPLLFLPLFTRKFQRYILLIPYILVNLISDYAYQHDIFFQYGFGSTAFLLYLTAVNLTDWKPSWRRVAVALTAVAVSIGCFGALVIPKANVAIDAYQEHETYYQQLEQALEQIPAEVSVATTTFYAPHLADRQTLYDIRYCSREHVLECEYVVLKCSAENDYKKYAQGDRSGFDGICRFLEENGYTLTGRHGNIFVIYQKEG